MGANASNAALGADFRDFDDTTAGAWIFHGTYKCSNHLLVCYQTKAQCTFACRRNYFAKFVHRDQSEGPPMAWAEDVPRAEDGCVHAALCEQLFAFGTYLDVCFHHGRGMSDTEVNEVLHARFFRGFNGAAGGDEIYIAKFFSFCWAGVGYTNQVNKGIRRANLCGIGSSTQRVANNWFTTYRKLAFRARSH